MVRADLNVNSRPKRPASAIYAWTMAGLEPEQRQLLSTIVELVRSVPRHERHIFFLIETMEGADLLMPGAAVQPRVLATDVRALQYASLIRQAPGAGLCL